MLKSKAIRRFRPLSLPTSRDPRPVPAHNPAAPRCPERSALFPQTEEI